MTAIPPRPDGLHPTSYGGPPAADAAAPRVTWSVAEALTAYLLGWLASEIAVAPFVGTSDIATLPADLRVAVGLGAGLIVLTTLAAWLRIRHRGSLAALGLSVARPFRDLGEGLLFGALLYPAIAFAVASLVQIGISVLSGREVSAPQQIPVEGLSTIGIAIVVVYGIIVAPIGEELFFRGILYGAIGQRYGTRAASLWSALLFALVHFMRGPLPDAVLLMSVMVPTGLALAWIRARRGSLYASIGAHVAFNVIGLVLILSVG